MFVTKGTGLTFRPQLTTSVAMATLLFLFLDLHFVGSMHSKTPAGIGADSFFGNI